MRRGARMDSRFAEEEREEDAAGLEAMRLQWFQFTSYSTLNTLEYTSHMLVAAPRQPKRKRSNHPIGMQHQ